MGDSAQTDLFGFVFFTVANETLGFERHPTVLLLRCFKPVFFYSRGLLKAVGVILNIEFSTVSGTFWGGLIDGEALEEISPAK